MRFELATVISCGADGCRVTPVDGGPAFEARYSALVRDKIRILPGQMVAVDMQPKVPEVAWRWYRARVVEQNERQVIVDERERRQAAARVTGLETEAGVGDEVWVTGMDAGWELHDRVIDGKPSAPDRLREKALPRIAELLAEE